MPHYNGEMEGIAIQLKKIMVFPLKFLFYSGVGWHVKNLEEKAITSFLFGP